MPTIEGVTYTQAWAEAVSIAPVDRAILVTLEFIHVNFSQPARVVANRADISARLEADAPYNANQYVTFTGIAVEVLFPEESTEEANPTVSIAVDNVSDMLVPYLDLAIQTTDPVEMIVREYVSTDLTQPARLPVQRLTVKNVSVTQTRVVIQAGYSDPMNKAFPGKLYTSLEYPNLTSR